MYKSFLKRGFDFFLSLIALIFLFPIIGIAALLLAIAQKGNVFFIQSRPGRNAKVFKIIKFKTMTDEKDDKGKLLPDEKRLTKIGKFVRSTSIDELPQLINVVKGDMSIVGPRPLLVKYLPLYSDFQARRHNVRPGITGWAQVNGRNAISWDNKFELDVWYTENLSFLLDLKIILLTTIKVFWREGISAGTSATMETFTGNKKNELT